MQSGRASEGVRGRPGALRCNQMHSDALRCTQMQSPLDRLLVHQLMREAIICTQTQSPLDSLLVHQLQLLQHTTGPLQPLTIDRLSTGLRRE